MVNQRYTTIRVPIEVKEEADRLREQLEQNEDYKWVGAIALGAVLLYALSKAQKRR